MATQRADAHVLARPVSDARPVPRLAGHRRHRLSSRPRRSRSAPVAHRRSLWRLPGDSGVVAGDGSSPSRRSSGPRRSAAAGGHPGAKRSARRACWKVSSSAWTCCLETSLTPSTCAKAPCTTASIRGTGRRPGLFLDQRENREAAARYARGRLLDCFSYNGGFALSLAPQCDAVLAIDISEDAVARIRDERRAQRLDERDGAPRTSSTNCALERRRALRHHRARPAGVREEQGLGREGDRRLQGNQPSGAPLLTPGGSLVTCSCSYNVNEAAFLDIVASAAIDARAVTARREAHAGARSSDSGHRS